MEQLPTTNKVNENETTALVTAALLSVIESAVRKSKPLWRIPDCIQHAGLPWRVASNKSIQQRVRRLKAKLYIDDILCIVDNLLLPTTTTTLSFHIENEKDLHERRRLTMATIVHLVVVETKGGGNNNIQRLTLSHCMLHAGFAPHETEDPTMQRRVLIMSNQLSLDNILEKVNALLHGQYVWVPRYIVINPDNNSAVLSPLK